MSDTGSWLKCRSCRRRASAVPAGTGLGRSISSAIVRDDPGAVEDVPSRPAGGAKIIVTFPPLTRAEDL